MSDKSAAYPNFDPLNFRDYMASIGLSRIVTDVSEGTTSWHVSGSRPTFEVLDVSPDQLATLCADWVSQHGSAFDDDGRKDVKSIDPDGWRELAGVENDLQSCFWAAICSDGVPHENQGKKNWSRLAASSLEYAQGGGGGYSNWIGSMAAFLGNRADRYAGGKGSAGVALSDSDFKRVLAGAAIHTHSQSTPPPRGEETVSSGSVVPLTVCRWDALIDRNHATHHVKPANDPILQDQTVNALATIGLASCPSAPTSHGLSTPFVTAIEKGGEVRLSWPLWTAPMRSPSLEAAFSIGPQCWGHWPVVTGRRYYAEKVPVFAQGTLKKSIA